MAKEEPITYKELVEEETRKIHSALLEGGGKSMQAAVFWAMNAAIMWRHAEDEKLNKKKR